MNNQQLNKPQYFSVFQLREILRQQANETAALLSRSVGRLTSCEPDPCLEYAEEVNYQQQLGQKLFYLQHCRNALERSIASQVAVLRYRWPDGTSSRTTFRKAGPNRVKVTGFKN